MSKLKTFKLSAGALARGGNVEEHLKNSGLSGLVVRSVSPELDEVDLLIPEGITDASVTTALKSYTGAYSTPVVTRNKEKENILASAEAKVKSGDTGGALTDLLMFLRTDMSPDPTP